MEKLLERMKELRFNKTTLAKEIGVSRATVVNWFSKKHPPSIYNLQRIANALNFTLQDVQKIFLGKGDE